MCKLVMTTPSLKILIFLLNGGKSNEQIRGNEEVDVRH